MKKCTKCLIEKPESEFFFKVKKTGKLQARCKTCYKEQRATYSKEHYEKFGDEYRARAIFSRAKIKIRDHNNMVEFLRNKSCEQCGESDIRVLDFDHIDPATKSFTIGAALARRSWRQIELEITKCRILCANCHRKHTAFQTNSYRFRAIT